MKKTNSQLNSGFTLVELLVVISVLAILTALLVSNLNSARVRARDAQRKNDFDQIKKALRMYYNDYSGQYPTASGNDEIVGCGPDGDSDCSWGGYFGDSASDYYYMKFLPADPVNDSGSGLVYAYSQPGGDQTFCLVAVLENTADSAAGVAQTQCASVCAGFSGSQYVVCPD